VAETAPDNPAQPSEWLGQAVTVPGSWWPDYAAWLAERSGEERECPPALGGQGFPAADPAPGTYVFDR
jgi:polyhydroxyalkanoate synthase subunit PhaC